jgi:hypothetical protein
VAGGRWLLTGGGGYEHVHVVPRTWTHLLFEAADRPIDPASPTPRSWREYVSLATSQSAPETMTEGGHGHFDPLTAFDNDRLRVGSVEPGQRLVGFHLGRLAGPLRSGPDQPGR